MIKSPKSSIGTNIILCLSFLFLSFLFLSPNNAIAAEAKKEKTKEKQIENQAPSYYCKQFQDILQRVEKDYIGEVDYQSMTDEAINGMLLSLDPYSGYYVDEDLEFFIDQTDGEFGGIGVEIIPDQGALKVISPIDDLPAYKAGIKAGDYIVGVNGQLVSTLGYNKSVRQMRGQPGTRVNLLVVKEDGQTIEVDLKREVVKITPVKYDLEIDDYGSIGYVRISTFNNQTVNETKKAVKDLAKKSKDRNRELKGIILDVRNNPGGLVDQAVAVAEYFIDHGVIVSTQGKRPEDNLIISAGRFVDKAPKVPMVVLINSGSASSAEILAGALQDHNRAILVGTTSFGKGLVQTFTQINKRAAVKFTTAKYLTPNGRSINAKGIEPDITVENAKVEYPQQKDTKTTVFNESSIKSYLKKYNNDDKAEDKPSTNVYDASEKVEDHKKMSEKYQKDYQYARAYDLIRGLIIKEQKSNKGVE